MVYQPFLLRNTCPSLMAQVDMKKIQVMPVDFPLSHPLQAGDVVLRSPLRDGSAWIYWLIEVQASKDLNMPLRLLLYKVEILKYHLQSDDGRRDKKPPILLGIVVYLGLKKWHPETLDAFAPLDSELREVARNAFAGDSQFVNVKDVNTHDLQDTPALQATTLLMQHAYAHDKVRILRDTQHLLKQVYKSPGGLALGDAMLRYVLHEAGQQKALNGKIIVKDMNDNLHDGVVKDRAMSIADILKHEGRQLGLQEGLREGLQEGLQKGLQEGLQKGGLKKALEIACSMLGEDIPTATIAKITQLPEPVR